MARVDIIMPVRNGERFLAETLTALQAQTFKDWRLLAIEHASVDSTPEILAAWRSRDPRIEILPFPKERSLSDALNWGLDKADCEFAVRQDADDLSKPERIATLVEAFDAEPDKAFLGSHGDIIDQDGRKIAEMDVALGDDAIRAVCLFGGIACHPSVAFRMSSLREVGARYGAYFLDADPRDHNYFVPRLAEDYFLFGQLALLRPGRNLTQNLFQYREHGGNISKAKVADTIRAAARASCCLGRAFSAIYGLPPVRPLPFVNHCDMLLDLHGGWDFRDDFRILAEALTRAFKPSAGLVRELSFRSCLKDRRRLPMAMSFALHAQRHGMRQSEKNSIKTWLLRGLRDYPIETIVDPVAELDA